jgi:hypothetical protein
MLMMGMAAAAGVAGIDLEWEALFTAGSIILIGEDAPAEGGAASLGAVCGKGA